MKSTQHFFLALFIRNERIGRLAFNAEALKALGIDPTELEGQAGQAAGIVAILSRNPDQRHTLHFVAFSRIGRLRVRRAVFRGPIFGPESN
jgi:hypothetical protein